MTMMNRRQFVWVAAGSAVLGRVTGGLAAGPYDLIVKGGRVIDPSVRLDAIRDVADRRRPHRGRRDEHRGRGRG